MVEYLLKSQWFVRCQEMGDRAAKARPCTGRAGPEWELMGIVIKLRGEPPAVRALVTGEGGLEG